MDPNRGTGRTLKNILHAQMTAIRTGKPVFVVFPTERDAHYARRTAADIFRLHPNLLFTGFIRQVMGYRGQVFMDHTVYDLPVTGPWREQHDTWEMVQGHK